MSVTKLVQQYIAERSSIKDCLKRGLVNYSALSREICKSAGTRQFDAVLKACRRHAQRIAGQPAHERRIMSLIRKARMRMTNKIIVAIAEKPRDFERLYTLQRDERKRGADFQLIEGNQAVVVIAVSDAEETVRDVLRGRIKKVSRGLVQIAMQFDERIESTHGVVSFVYGLLAEHGINVLEEMSCWTDLMIVIAEKDAAKAMLVLGRVE